MKFTCDSCNAQYMISDDKVGPAGVKVRCKKCGHVILVRKVAELAAGDTAPAVAAPVAAGPSPSANGATHPGTQAQRGGAPAGGGLDQELGSAFDHAFGDTPPATERPGAGADLGATQAMSAEDAAKVLSDPAPSATEWYVAIGQAQVGPLPLGEVKKKWEAGDVGPDSLVWRPGMGDWAPLTTVSDLAGFLAPVPRPAPQGSRSAARPAAEPAKAAKAAEPEAAPAAEVSWKPAGASALAALASEELASRAPDARPAPVRPAGVKSLVDALPDGGGVDPTGALPLNIKALEANTGERKIDRRSSVARGAEKVRHRRSATRALVVGLVVGVLAIAGLGAAAMKLGLVDTSRILGRPAAPSTAAIPLPPPPALPAQTAPAPQPAAAAAAAPPPSEPAVAAAQPERRPEPAAEPRPEPRPERHATASSRPPRTEPPPAREPPRVASNQQPAQQPQQAPAKKGEGLLDFDSGGSDSALDEALGGGPQAAGKRSVYVPPARAGGGGGALPEKVSPGEINGAVAQRIDALRKCVSEQKTREPDASGTLKMRWMIQGDGSVRDVKCVTPEYAQGQFAACLGGVVRSIRFPRSSTAGQEVTFPFNF